MRLLIFLIFFISSLNKTAKYYTDCLYDSPKSGFITYSDCQEYAKENSYCCLLYYTSHSTNYYDFFARKIDEHINKSRNETYGRKLLGRWNFCFGLTSEGYDNIEDVIEELEEESGLDDIDIDCSSKYFGINNIIKLIIFLLLIQ